MKKILMLGGSSQQVPVIQTAKDLGYYTVLIDYLLDNPGQYVADKWYCESTTDVNAVFEIAKKERVSGILAYASDPAALPAAIVAERLGLPGNPSKSVEILGIKYKFREFLKGNGFACPLTYKINVGNAKESIVSLISKLKFPIVIKPTDSSGSKGVTMVKDENFVHEAIKNAATYSRNGILIAEEYIERGFPSIIGGDIFVENGDLVLLGDLSCIRDEERNGLIPIGKQYPDGLNEQQKRQIKEELQRVISLLGIKGGEFNIEVIIDKDNKPCFLEIGPRAGGNMIPILLSDIYNIDLLKANIALAMGEKADIKPIYANESYMTYVLHSHDNGRFEGVEYSDKIKPYIYRKVLYREIGDNIEIFDGAGKAIGIIFMRFPDRETMMGHCDKIDNLIKVLVR